MAVKLDYNNMIADIVGAEGISLDDIMAINVKSAHEKMERRRKTNPDDWRNLPFNQGDVVQEIKKYVLSVKDDIDAFIVLGIGGSALGPIALQQAINHPYYNELPKNKRGGYPKLYVMDNVDPERFSYFFEIVDIKKCLFNCISKSGSTCETMSQFMIIKALLEKELGKGNIAKNIVCTTDKDTGNLIKIAKDEGYKTFYIPNGVGGRFSELSPVGLLPAAMCGIDIEKLLEGAADIDTVVSQDDIVKNPAYMYAALHYVAMKKGKNISVMMPYADSLKYISDWYAQLWAESLGKKYDNEGNAVFVGQTPVKALGVTDQHSQVQLYTQGPFDKIIVLLSVEEFRRTIDIPKTYKDIPSLGFLGGITQNTLLKTEEHATEYALVSKGRPNMTISLKKVDEYSMGALLYMLEVATGFMGEIMNINAYDQPGVEDGKDATYALLNRPGYDKKREQLNKRQAKNSLYIIG